MAPRSSPALLNRPRCVTYVRASVVSVGVLWSSISHASELPSAPEPHLAQSSAPAPTAAAASLQGTILDPDSAFIPGARISLLPGDGPPQETTSAANGTFRLNAIPPGTFTLTVTCHGFTPSSLTGTLAPGQALETAPITLQLAPVTTTVDALDLPTALEQIHNEEHQRLVGILPNFFVSYNWYAPPLTTRQKYTLALRNASDPGNIMLVGITAGVQQAADAFPGYGQGAAGYGKRYGADLGNLVVGTFMGGAVLPSLFHQDPRYFYKGSGTTRQRLVYALSRAVITRGDNGRWQPNYSGVFGDLSAGAISNLYYAPSDRQGARLTVINGFLGVAGDAMNGVFQEFFLRKFTPKAKQQTISAP